MHSDSADDNPVVFRDNWRTVLKVMVFGLGAVVSSIVSSIVSAFSLSYATNSQFVPGSVMLAVNITTAALGIASQPLFGMLADRIGRKPVCVPHRPRRAAYALARPPGSSHRTLRKASPAVAKLARMRQEEPYRPEVRGDMALTGMPGVRYENAQHGGDVQNSKN
ncbi:hypothetical protein [Arthrobacter sp. MMS18-M83]|uniref:hypothetical protein n=1 Tax=Arthrobacter sp. MMS18-M83 TaxID=2996261 RepID=UPI00227D008B|nr:hypothetical protein [Arthrobacter sp. MMS18-M83]WAH96238.1 hypothetical protein OW521_17700 [Arthrobacter sp. MMS18-M83]